MSFEGDSILVLLLKRHLDERLKLRSMYFNESYAAQARRISEVTPHRFAKIDYQIDDDLINKQSTEHEQSSFL